VAGDNYVAVGSCCQVAHEGSLDVDSFSHDRFLWGRKRGGSFGGVWDPLNFR
jgi:hypothetical protein